jgi:hypothetical protein
LSVGRPQLTKNQSTEIRECFDIMIKAEAEWMAPDEFYRAMHALGFMPQQGEAEAMFAELDTDGNGRLDFEEFTQFMSGCVNHHRLLGVHPPASFDESEVALVTSVLPKLGSHGSSGRAGRCERAEVLSARCGRTQVHRGERGQGEEGAHAAHRQPGGRRAQTARRPPTGDSPLPYLGHSSHHAALLLAALAGGEQQSAATPQAARGWAHPPYRHFQDPILLTPWLCFRGGGVPNPYITRIDVPCPLAPGHCRARNAVPTPQHQRCNPHPNPLQTLAARMGDPITPDDAKELVARGVDGCGTLLPGFPTDEWFDELYAATSPAALRARYPAKPPLPVRPRVESNTKLR